jgi:hypothetical protein
MNNGKENSSQRRQEEGYEEALVASCVDQKGGRLSPPFLLSA